MCVSTLALTLLFETAGEYRVSALVSLISGLHIVCVCKCLSAFESVFKERSSNLSESLNQ